mmetsp:Transcript_11522/g.21269  ORF Transcript_11522/g.21269 Transcript_11522/m.21269 type:complete len:122 (-) Transcript_11522:683-1048(-)
MCRRFLVADDLLNSVLTEKATLEKREVGWCGTKEPWQAHRNLTVLRLQAVLYRQGKTNIFWIEDFDGSYWCPTSTSSQERWGATFDGFSPQVYPISAMLHGLSGTRYMHILVIKQRSILGI